MNFFKKKELHSLLLITLVVLAGCSAAVDGENNTETQDNLSVDSFTLESKQKRYNDLASPLTVTDKAFVLKACLVESLLLKSLHGKNFILTSQDGEQLITTDAKGCIRFTENITLGQDSANKHYQTFERTLKSTDGHFTPITLKYAINPWDETFIDIKTIDNFQEQFISANKFDQQPLIVIDTINGSFSGIVSRRDSTSSDVQFLTQLNSCVHLPIENGSSLRNQNFKATITNLETKESFDKLMETTQSGCLRTSYQSSYDQNSRPRWIPHEIHIEAIGGAFSGQTQTRLFYLFPWTTGSLFFWDSQLGEPPQAPIEEMSKIYIPDYTFTYTGNDSNGYHITKSLVLSIVKNYRLEMTPFREDAHNFMGDLPYQPINSGEFEVKVLVLSPKTSEMTLTKDNESQFTPVMSSTTKARVINGRLRTDLKFRILFNDTPKLQSRMISVIEIRPVDESSSLKPIIISGEFFGDTQQFTRSAQIQSSGSDSIKELNEEHPIVMKHLTEIEEDNREKLKDPWILSNLETFKVLHSESSIQKDVETIYINQLKEKKNLTFSETDFANLFEYTKLVKTLNKFCTMVLPSKKKTGIFGRSVEVQNEKLADCLKNPENYIKATSQKVINEIIEQPRRINSYTDDINVGTGFFMFNTDSERVSNSTRWSYGSGISGKIEVPFISLFSVGGGVNYDVSVMNSTDEAVGSTHRGSFSRGRSLSADTLTLSFKAQMRKCIFIVATELADTRERIHLCDSKTLNQEISESWYYISEGSARMSVLRDRWSSEENLMLKLIRGESEFERFYNLMSDETKAIYLRRVKTVSAPESYFKHFYEKRDNIRPSLEDGALPGIIELAN